ncbi:hypothetical protein KK083_03995 [Fulvivirgaceae bacterium PWU4]|uniref:Uncharacterized protein n=1 Tax=Chryseosolibacter histidini TaxID=2782349 RepID=A0AAP2GMQ4_9BACT|nr:hypothetical protein [Chryseosolibacter histidini]MBT1696025.1 hypothetical protein [Chryseosolibacter histidini]
MKLRIIGLILLLSCCGQQEKINKDIAELKEKLPKLEPPLNFNSDRKMKLRSIELPDNELIKKLKEKSYFTLVGKVFETDNNITILGYVPDDIGTPILITYDNSGNELSSHAIYENAMGDMGHYTTNIVTITPDRQILFTDSTTTRKINAEGTDEIPGTDSLSVTHKKYRLTDQGLIENVE